MNAALLAPEFAVGTLDAGLILAPENRPVVAGDLASQEPFTAWLRRGIDRDRIFAEPKLYEPLGTAELIREQSRQRFGRSRGAIERQRQIRLPEPGKLVYNSTSPTSRAPKAGNIQKTHNFTAQHIP